MCCLLAGLGVHLAGDFIRGQSGRGRLMPMLRSGAVLLRRRPPFHGQGEFYDNIRWKGACGPFQFIFMFLSIYLHSKIVLTHAPPHPLLKHVLVTLGKVKLVILVFRSTIDYFLNICVCDINHSFVATLVLCNISNVAYFLPKSVGRWK